MIKLLAGIFIGSNNYKDAAVRKKYGVLCSILGIVLNFLLFITKLVAGLVSGAIAITADAFNNLSDAASSIITLAGFKLAAHKPDKEHPFGHGRIEYISGLLVAVMIILMAYELIKSSIMKIVNPVIPEFSPLIVAILIISILIKIYMVMYNRQIGIKIDSSAMRATSKDSLSDVFATTLVLISAIVAHYKNIPIDGVCGVLVGLFILYAGIDAMKDTIDPLLGRTPDPELVNEIKKIVRSYDKVIGIHDLVVHDYGPGRVMITLHVEVPYREDILELHSIIDNIEFDIKGMLGCDAVIHMDPVVDDDEETSAAKAKVEEILAEMDENFTFHDFHMEKSVPNSKLIFDLVIPHEYQVKDNEISDAIVEKIHEYNPSYNCIIQVERPGVI